MLEVVAVAGVRDDLDGECLDVGADAAGLSSGGAGLVGETDDVVDLALLLGGLPHAHGAGHVGVVVVIASAVVHHDEVTLAHDRLARLGVRVGAVRARGDDGVERQGVRAVHEHVVLELGANLLLRETRLDEAADVVEGGVGRGLRVTHKLDLLGVLDLAQVADVPVHPRHEAGDRRAAALVREVVKESEVKGVLDGDRVGAGLEDAGCRPPGGVDDVHVDAPRRVGAETREEGVVVARVGVEPEPVLRDEGGVRRLVVEGALRPGEPPEVGVVADDRRVVASFRHERAEARDATRACECVYHDEPLSVECPLSHAATLARTRHPRGQDPPRRRSGGRRARRTRHPRARREGRPPPPRVGRGRGPWAGRA